MGQIYHERNLKNIETLGDNTKVKAKQFYDKCIALNAQVLIYEGIRSIAKQKENVAKGVSKTMKSYHLVGQAFDFVPVDSKGNTLFSLSAYKKSPYKEAIAYAKSIGLEWGGDWSSFVDAPHLQYNYKGYGTDTFSGKPSAVPPTSKGYLAKGDKGAEVTQVQKDLKTIGYKIDVDGIFGAGMETTVRKFQADYKLSVDGIFGAGSKSKLAQVVKDKTTVKPKPPQTSTSAIKAVGKIKVDGVKNFTYVYAKTSDKSDIVQKAGKGTIYNISGSVPGWYEVIIGNRRCYIKSQYCSKI